MQVKPPNMPEIWVNIPPVPMRPTIVRDTHEGLAHCGREKLVEALQTTYWWPGLRTQTMELLRHCPICQPEKIPLPQLQQPRLNNMTSRPGLGWSLDLAGPFKRDEGGGVYLAVAVCVHSKWVEAR